MKFSVLMSLYAGSRADEFARCFDSINAQTRQPDEIVVILDGPVAETVTECLAHYRSTISVPVNIHAFDSNRGLGDALADGINACSYSIVARVDTDDISVPDRFQLQHDRLAADNELSVVGGLMEELSETTAGNSSMVRTVPLDHAAIRQAATYRNPVNHPTVMLRRGAVLAAGNYRKMLWFEDYDLWTRMLQAECRFANIDKVLVYACADSDYYRRRGGLKYFQQEIKLAQAFRRSGFHRPVQSIRFLLTRFGFRIIPVSMRSWLYPRLLRTTQPGNTSE